MRSKTVISFIAYLFLFSCNNNAVIKNDKIDEFISKYENVKFEELKDVSISQRSKSAGGTNELPFLLRLKTFTGDSVIKKGYVYDLYRKNWYLNRTRRKE